MENNWNLGEKGKKGLKKKIEHAVLVGLITQHQTSEQVDEYLDELEFLAETAGAKTVKRFKQKLSRPDKRFFVGSGKIDEVLEYLEAHEEVSLVIFDDDLTGKQTGNLEEHLKVKIVDRSSLILDIFANRAQTAQAKTQVELAQMQYLLPRLRGLWTHLERQRGGIGMRGPGEKEIETDRRIVRDKISLLKKKLEKIDLQNTTRRKNRQDLIRVGLVGYTNVGKSTLMNILSKSTVFAEDKLFATLDTTVRKVVLGTTPFLLSDTVGFIRKLPHHLVESFKSTLDEAKESDVLLHVVDVSHPQYEDQVKTVLETLVSLKCEDKPILMVYNKMDKYRDLYLDKMLTPEERSNIETDVKNTIEKQQDYPSVFISAKEKEGLDVLRAKILEMVTSSYAVVYPYQSKQWS